MQGERSRLGLTAPSPEGRLSYGEEGSNRSIRWGRPRHEDDAVTSIKGESGPWGKAGRAAGTLSRESGRGAMSRGFGRHAARLRR